MPTNLIKRLPLAPNQSNRVGAGRRRVIVFQAGTISLKLALLETATAARIAQALPLYGVAEPWGQSVHFKLPIDTGRDRGARINARLGEVYYWAEEDRVLLPFGPTPISRDTEIRLPRPCNAWAEVIGDISLLRQVKPGAKITLKTTG